jgi:alkaline phosphatase D
VFGPPGKRVQIIMLDTRFFRSPLKQGEAGAEGRRPYVPDPDPSKTMLGEAQWRWLAQELRRPAEVRLIVSSVQVLADGHTFEGWRTLPREQRRLFDTIRASRAEGVVFLSGDRHLAALYRRAGLLPYPVAELTASSLNRPAVKSDAEWSTAQIGRVFTPANFGLVEIDWSARRLSLSVRDADGAAQRRLDMPFRENRPLILFSGGGGL